MSGLLQHPLFIDTRARAYLLWAVLLPIGFVATHFHQEHNINALWTLISIVGLGYMYRVMPMRVRQMQRILGAWLVPIFLGLCVSGLVFYVHNGLTNNIIAHLGAFWLGVMAVGYFLNGLADSEPTTWYWVAVVLHAAAAVLCWYVDAFTAAQYLIAAIISCWSMLNLWLFRSSI